MRAPLSLFIASLLVSASGIARAQNAQGFALNRFDPSERGSNWFALDSLDLRGSPRVFAGVIGDWAHKPLVLYAPDGSEKKRLVGDQLFVDVGGGIVIADRLRLGVNVPIAAYEHGEQGTLGTTTYSPPSSASVGDIRLSGDIRLFGEYGDPLTAAFGAEFFLPTGQQSDYTGDGKLRIMPRLLGAGDIGAFAYAVKLGGQYRALDQGFGASSIGSELLFGAAAGIRTAERKLVIGPEIFGSTVVSKSNAAFKKLTTPLELLFGAHYTFGDFQAGAGVGPGLTRGFGSPQVRVLLGLEYVPAIVPPAPPSDRDHDGVLDSEDACPDTPGVRTDDPKTNGCPADRDKDGVLDADDACPDTPGVKTDDPKTNGCPPPPPDRDHDGIVDADDACPDTPGVKTNDPKTNGCPPPPPDRDHDGIVDADDACPDQPGPRNEDPKKNGCPEARIEAGEIKILQQVKFKTGSAVILPESDHILTAVLDILSSHTEIKKVRVEGHTDNRGGAAMNMALSSRRAASVATWLVKHGVDKSRITSKGFGLTRPIDTNATEEGRQNNRRVEFHIESDAEPKK